MAGGRRGGSAARTRPGLTAPVAGGVAFQSPVRSALSVALELGQETAGPNTTLLCAVSYSASRASRVWFDTFPLANQTDSICIIDSFCAQQEKLID